MPSREVSKRIRDTLIGLFQGPRDELSSTIEVTRDLTARTLRAVRGKRPEASQHIAEEAVEGAIRAGSETGTELNSVAKGAVIGAVEGVSDVTKVDESVVTDAAAAAVKGASKAGGDVITVAKKVIEGAIEVSDRVGIKAEDAAYAAVAGILQATESISQSTATAVTKAISGTISGIRIVTGVPAKKQIILVLDSNRANLELLSQQLLKEGYETLSATNLEELDQAIRRRKKVALGLMDISGFDQSIWERCETLRKAKIPFIVISPQRSPLIQRDSMKHGASGLLVKPVGIKELIEYIHTLLGE